MTVMREASSPAWTQSSAVACEGTMMASARFFVISRARWKYAEPWAVKWSGSRRKATSWTVTARGREVGGIAQVVACTTWAPPPDPTPSIRSTLGILRRSQAA